MVTIAERIRLVEKTMCWVDVEFDENYLAENGTLVEDPLHNDESIRDLWEHVIGSELRIEGRNDLTPEVRKLAVEILCILKGVDND